MRRYTLKEELLLNSILKEHGYGFFFSYGRGCYYVSNLIYEYFNTEYTTIVARSLISKYRSDPSTLTAPEDLVEVFLELPLEELPLLMGHVSPIVDAVTQYRFSLGG